MSSQVSDKFQQEINWHMQAFPGLGWGGGIFFFFFLFFLLGNTMYSVVSPVATEVVLAFAAHFTPGTSRGSYTQISAEKVASCG